MPDYASSHVESLACDLLVVGGGINGAGIARDAAGRGLSVVLCEKDDLASHTSSASTKLIHGGLRYLEYYEFHLVRKALIEREVLLRSAPHIIWPLRFVMPQERGQRPAWMIRAGLLMYDMLARRELLPGSSGINLLRHPAGAALKAGHVRGFEYSDGWVDDARLVVLNAIDAAEKGATILTQQRCEHAERHADHWQVTTRDVNQSLRTIRARALVNATGPWAAQFLHANAGQAGQQTLRLIKGSHIIVKRLFEHPYAYIFQHPDGRIVFAIPYEHEFTLLGTTDLDYQGDLDKVTIAPSEVDYICGLSNRYFRTQISAADVVWSYSGVRPLVEDASAKASAVTRDYHLEFDLGTDAEPRAPLLSVFGGKITTFRKLAEEALDQLAPALSNHNKTWTANACLPGGDIDGPLPSNRSVLEFDAWLARLQQQYAWLPAALVTRYARAYGTRTHQLLAGCTEPAQLGQEIASGLFAIEVTHLIKHEWARTAHDILWRRSKLGLHLPADTESRLDEWIRATDALRLELADTPPEQKAAVR
ncbi:MAG: glycerol-3-phosphate dehydrogenase [Herbaspirillum sp.]